MTSNKKSTFPRILFARRKTQPAEECQSLPYDQRKQFISLKAEFAGSQYIKNWINKDRIHEKMVIIYNKNYRAASSQKIDSKRDKTLPAKCHKVSLEKDQHNDLRAKQTQTQVQEQLIKPNELSEIELFYAEKLKDKQPLREYIKAFRKILEETNPLFQKISPIISQTFLKIGSIVTYVAGQYIYKEKHPVKNIGIVLWGDVLLKRKNTKFKFACFPGYAIGQELIFQKRDTELLTSERCKASKNCGILLINVKQYSYLFQGLLKEGFKDIIMKFQNLIFRTYLKKKEMHRILG